MKKHFCKLNFIFILSLYFKRLDFTFSIQVVLCFYSSLTADAYESSRMLCDQYYLMSPDVKIEQVNCEQDLSFHPILPFSLSFVLCPVHGAFSQGAMDWIIICCLVNMVSLWKTFNTERHRQRGCTHWTFALITLLLAHCMGLFFFFPVYKVYDVFWCEICFMLLFSQPWLSSCISILEVIS